MFSYLYDLLQGYDIPGIGLLRYISFRAVGAFVVSILFVLLLGERTIRAMRRHQVGEEIRDLGLQGQVEKKGTPTMGGILFVGGTLVATLLFGRLQNVYVIIMLVSTLWLALLGFADDFLKWRQHSKKGLNGWLKILFQGLLGLFVALTLYLSPQVGERNYVAYQGSEVIATSADSTTIAIPPLEKSLKTTIPFLKNNQLDYRSLIPVEGLPGNRLAWGLFFFVVVIVVLSVSNGANLTDGLDGLATGVSIPMAATLGVFAYLSGNVIFANYLNIMLIPHVGELVVFMAAFVGALVGFLWFNGHPAKVFMGDTGSLTIGGVIGIFAILVRKELLLPLLCGIFLMESLSVIIQVLFFKYTRIRTGEGRRVFLMTPIHHHFEKKGMPETRIVLRMWIVSILLAVLTVITLKIR